MRREGNYIIATAVVPPNIARESLTPIFAHKYQSYVRPRGPICGQDTAWRAGDCDIYDRDFGVEMIDTCTAVVSTEGVIGFTEGAGGFWIFFVSAHLLLN